MGQVYQATDTTLDRQVAIKVLPDAFADDADRLARFEREAKVLASLNHPNIGAIYGLEKSGDTRALVLELVEGPTLADRISKGPIPVDEALPIAKQIAEALEAAHEAGVIHRDLKPANIKVKDDGTVKVLDFGLAKALDTTPEGDPSQSPTLTAAATQMGVIMGTAAYMSPEQARGKTVDKRADIWSFGVVFYEMLTGQRAFQGEDVSLTLASVMKSDLKVKTLPPDLPANVRTVLRRCLEKDASQRIRDMGDVRLAMEGAFETGVSAPSAPTAAPTLQVWQRPMPAAILVLGVAAAASLAVWMILGPLPQAADVTRLTVGLPAGLQPTGLLRRVVLSPDGRTLAFNAVDEGDQAQLYVRPMNQFDATALRDTSGAIGAFFSPDGTSVGFASGNSINRVSLQGGPAQTLGQTTGSFGGGTWGRDDRIIFGSTTGLWEVPAAGGEPKPLTTLDANVAERAHAFPHFLPGGSAILFMSCSDAGCDVELMQLDTSERRVLVENGYGPQHIASGHIIFGRDDSIWAIPFDTERLDVTGEPFPVLEGVQKDAITGARFSASRDGTLVYLTGDPLGGNGRIPVWVDRNGVEEPIPIEPEVYAYPRISPDGGTIALSGSAPFDIWNWSVTRQTRSRFTFEDAVDAYPTWSPDGQTLMFTSNRGNGVLNLFRRRADGTGSVERITESATPHRSNVVSPDGNWLVFGEQSPDTQMDLAIVSLQDEDGSAEMLVQTEFSEQNADISPNGNWLAYESNPSGQFEVFVRPFPDTEGGLQQVSAGGGRMPRWSPDGRELFYWAPPGQMMAVQVDTGSSLILDRPEAVFDGPYFAGDDVSIGRTFDVSPDGERFLMIKRVLVDDTAEQRIHIVQNWHQELLERVPVN